MHLRRDGSIADAFAIELSSAAISNPTLRLDKARVTASRDSDSACVCHFARVILSERYPRHVRKLSRPRHNLISIAIKKSLNDEAPNLYVLSLALSRRLSWLEGKCGPDRFKSRPTGWRWSYEMVPSRFSRLLALMSQINNHPSGGRDAYPVACEKTAIMMTICTGSSFSDACTQYTIYNNLPRPAISFSL